MWFYLFLFKTLYLEFETMQFLWGFFFSFIFILFSLSFLSSSIFIMEISCSKTGNSIQVDLTSGLPPNMLENQCSVTSENRIHFGFLYYLPLVLGLLFADWVNLTLVGCKCPLLHSFQFSILKSRLNCNSSSYSAPFRIMKHLTKNMKVKVISQS